jgi:hypothetical protein
MKATGLRLCLPVTAVLFPSVDAIFLIPAHAGVFRGVVNTDDYQLMQRQLVQDRWSGVRDVQRLQ